MPKSIKFLLHCLPSLQKHTSIYFTDFFLLLYGNRKSWMKCFYAALPPPFLLPLAALCVRPLGVLDRSERRKGLPEKLI